MTKVTIEIKDLSKVFGKTLKELSVKTQVKIGKVVQTLPQKFELEATSFYLSVLKAPTGRLRRSIKGFLRKLNKTVYVVGLRSDVNYALVQHEGFHGSVNIRQHMRRTKKGFTSVKRHTRMMNIKATKFLEQPIKNVLKEAIRNIRDSLK